LRTEFAPLLSAKLYAGKPEQVAKNIQLIRFPVIASPKYDGWRIFEFGGEATTRSMKPPANVYTQHRLRQFYARLKELCGVTGVDGEALVGSPTGFNAMQRSTSAFNTRAGEPEFDYYIFDSFQHPNWSFQERYDRLVDCVLPTLIPSEFPWVKLVEQVTIHNMEDLMAYERKCVEAGYEGIMFRDPAARYKFGRSSMREGILVAVKRWEDDEGVILEIREQMHNANEAKTNALGHTERSGHKENLIGKNTMGSVLVRSKRFDDTFSVGNGPGLDADLRKHIWENPKEYLGKLLTYRFQNVGIKTRPRHPQWKSVRAPDDLS
jgi:DNA ligase-1